MLSLAVYLKYQPEGKWLGGILGQAGAQVLKDHPKINEFQRNTPILIYSGGSDEVFSPEQVKRSLEYLASVYKDQSNFMHIIEDGVKHTFSD